MSDTDDDRRLHEAFAALEPAPAATARMQVRVVAAHDARPRSLWLEWWSLLRARPVANGALMAVAAVLLFFLTPLGVLPALLQRGSGPGPLAMRDSAPVPMAKPPSHADSPLIAAAIALEEQLERFHDGVDTFRKLPLNSKKNIDRATKLLNDLADGEQGLGTQVQALVQAVAGTRDQQNASVEVIRAKAEELKSRAVAFQQLLTQFEAMGVAASELNAKLQSSGPAEVDLAAALAALAAQAETLMGNARAQDFDDVARLGDGLKQQLNAMRKRLEGGDTQTSS
jgi:hypothetical protein